MSKIIEAFWNHVGKKDGERIAGQVAPDFAEEVADKLYSDDGHIHHTLKVFRPKGATGALPFIMDVHGGGWYYGDKELNEYFCKSLVQHGFAVADISYRLSPEADLRGQIADCFSAMKHLQENAEAYGLDVEKFFIAGDSAGGHLVGLIINIVKSKELQEYYGVTPSLDIKGAGLICPAPNPTLMSIPKCLLKVYFNDILGKGFLKNGTAEKVNFNNVLQKDVCPCFFISAYGDFMRDETKKAYEKVREQGTPTELFFLDKPMVEGRKLEHVFNVTYWDWEESLAANRAMCEFFKKYI